ncbi:YHS domain-containing (seleno)protein [Shewanella woodyi]|uniref:YHS domain-containing (seleno)protein n=1 Tax=Shewanella woodyi TaxID=60961 RepID=UPI0037482EAC
MKKSNLKPAKLAALAFLSTLAFSNPIFAADEHNVVPGLTAAGKPLGLHGVDPVSLLDAGQYIAGSATHTEVFDNVSYYFSSEANKESFKTDPEKYAPQNGGFCTFGVSVGKKFDGNPSFASINNGKLYVFLNEDIYKLFMKDSTGTITKAESQWKKIEHSSASSL